MSRKYYSNPKLIVLTRNSEENVLASCKSGIILGTSSGATYGKCGHIEDDNNCIGCSGVSNS